MFYIRLISRQLIAAPLENENLNSGRTSPFSVASPSFFIIIIMVVALEWSEPDGQSGRNEKTNKLNGGKSNEQTNQSAGRANRSLWPQQKLLAKRALLT